MRCVVDSSFLASLFLPDEDSAGSSVIAGEIARDGAAAPGLLQLELANLVLTAERRNRITSADRAEILEAIDALPIMLQPVLDAEQRRDAIRLAHKHGLTAYDAAYLELSRLNLPLATFDKALRKALAAEGAESLPSSVARV